MQQDYREQMTVYLRAKIEQLGYSQMRRLGGTMGYVWAAVSPSGQLVVVKGIDKMAREYVDALLYNTDEVTLAKRMQRSPEEWAFCIPVLAVHETPRYAVIVMKKAEGDLISLGGNPVDPANEDHLKTMIRDLLKSVQSCHIHGIALNDLKAENVLMMDGLVRLCDFGLATPLTKAGLTHWRGGSLPTRAPETFVGPVLSGIKSDVWSLGVVVYALWTRHHPWHSAEVGDCCYDWFLANGTPIPNYGNGRRLTGAQLDFLGAMLRVNPKDRHDIAELLHHPYLCPAATPTPTPVPVLSVSFEAAAIEPATARAASPLLPDQQECPDLSLFFE